MVRDEANRMKNVINGKKGGNPAFEKGKDNPYYKRPDNPTDNPKDNRKITPSSSSSFSSSKQEKRDAEEVPDMSEMFEAIWRDYPQRGRTKKVACQQYFVDIVGNLRGERLAAMVERIHEPIKPGGAWAESDKWASGYVQGLDTYLCQRQWDEEPVRGDDGERLTPAQREARRIEDSWNEPD
jgi:hypothetical protein